jgi:hypothetical protein
MKSWGGMAKKDKKAGNKDDRRLAPAGPEKPIEKAAKLPPKEKPKSKADRRKDRIDGIIKTVYPSILGTLAGFACYYFAIGQEGDPWTISLSGNALPWHTVMIMVIAATFLIQKLSYPFFKINAEQFRFKDWFYVEFMVVDLWLVSWTLLLN